MKVFNLFLEKNEKFTSIKTEEDSNSNMINIPDWNYYYPSYVPEGYQLNTKNVFNDIRIFKFKNELSEIIFGQGQMDQTSIWILKTLRLQKA